MAYQSPFYSPSSFGGGPPKAGPYRQNMAAFSSNDLSGHDQGYQWMRGGGLGDHKPVSNFHFGSGVEFGYQEPFPAPNMSRPYNIQTTSWNSDMNAPNSHGPAIGPMTSGIRPISRNDSPRRGRLPRGAFRGVYKPAIQAEDSTKKTKKSPREKEDSPQPLGIAALSIDFDPPVQDCELEPFVLLKYENGQQKFVSEDDDCHYKWHRGQKRTCSYPDCPKAADFQCLNSVKFNLPVTKSFFCSPEHFQKAWKTYHARDITERHKAREAKSEPEWIDDDGEHDVTPNKPHTTAKEGDDVGKELAIPEEKLNCRFPPVLPNNWTEVSEEKIYTPTLNDIGRMLLLVVRPKLKGKDGGPPVLGEPHTKDTKPVLRRPQPPPKRNHISIADNPDSHGHAFSVMTYNILADLYTNNTIFPYCPLYALNWNYRKHNLLREILTYRADIICLQEVQNNHFEEFFHPHLSKEGYEGIFKRKTRGEDFRRNDAENQQQKKMDGCAIFYRKDRFALMEQYHVEFNEAAKHMFKQQLRQSHRNANYSKLMKRLLKGNIALVLVLEEIPPPDATRGRRRARKRRLCVANTHIYWDPEFADIKLWQTWVLCQELSKLVSQRELPLILAGDFNSEPKSAVYELLSTQQCRHDDYEAFKKDKLKLLPNHTQLSHELQLTSAYSFMGEPKYTTYTGHFVGILDYIWYTKASLISLGILDVDDPGDIVGQGGVDIALPSRRHPSDHLSLVSTFCFAGA